MAFAYKDVDLTNPIISIIDKKMGYKHVYMIGEVVEFDKKTYTLTVDFYCSELGLSDDTPMRLSDIPIINHNTTDAGIYHNFQKGDKVLAILGNLNQREMLRGKIQKRKNARDLVQFCYVIGAVSEHTSLIEDDNYNMVIQGDIHFLGSLTVDGNITAEGDIESKNGDIKASGISLKNHVHKYTDTTATSTNTTDTTKPL